MAAHLFMPSFIVLTGQVVVVLLAQAFPFPHTTHHFLVAVNQKDAGLTWLYPTKIVQASN
jgi:hypothetical protein